MDADQLALIGLAALIAAPAGWWWARRSGARQAPLDAEFLKGLSHLLDDEPDRALETFERLAGQDDDGSVELQFALGGLFRRRGELARATRIHTALAARPGLDAATRARARLELGEDYLRAGVFDRAEAILGDLTRDPDQRAAALERLVRLYEQQRDWTQALRLTEELMRVDGVARQVAVAHHHCELAGVAAARGDRRGTRVALERALASDRHGVRARLQLARLEESEGRAVRAAEALEAALAIEPSRAADLLGWLARLHDETGRPAEFGAALERIAAGSALARVELARACALNLERDDPVVTALAAEWWRTAPEVASLVGALETVLAAPLHLDAPTLTRLRQALAERPDGGQRCVECGFEMRQAAWQCPSCRRWGTVHRKD
jgi:lipopolysaccharide biosynthesis regulator YciM